MGTKIFAPEGLELAMKKKEGDALEIRQITEFIVGSSN